MVEWRRLDMDWLARPLVCDGQVVLPGLDPRRITDADLKDICLRMFVVLCTIEMPICEGRHLPRDLFDQIDWLDSMVVYGHDGPARLSDWADLITEFGEHYRLDGEGPIPVNPAIYRKEAERYGRDAKSGE
jgi:hypothetical protein